MSDRYKASRRPVTYAPDGHLTDVRRDESGRPFCGAKTRSGKPCKRAPMLGRPRCANHGGKSLRGKDSPAYKDGRSSRYRTVLRLEEIPDNDIRLLDMRRPLQLTEEMISRMTERLKDNDSPAFRVEAKLRFGKLRDVMTNPDATPGQITAALNALGAWIDRGKREDSAVASITAAADKLSTQAKRAWDVRTSAAQAMNKSDAQDLLFSIVTIVREECGKDDAERVFARVWSETLGAGASGGGPGDGGDGDGQPRTIDAEVA